MTVRDKETKTIGLMIEYYCRKKHGTQNICPECAGLKAYSEKRTAQCVWKDEKPACVDCSIHCYNIEMKGKIGKVMRYAGPRMILVHPLSAIDYHLRRLIKK